MSEDYFIPCARVRFTTEDDVLIDGLWFGPRKAKNVIILVHGLASSVFSMSALVRTLATKDTAVMTFANRGTEKIYKMRYASKQKWKLVGGAHEKFTDCVHDLQGAVDFATRQGARSIYLAGNSTGCQKAVYWAHKKAGRGVKGLVLLAPISDHAYAVKATPKKLLQKALALSRKLVRAGRPHELLPRSLWPEVQDAQRFLSLYSGDSREEIFTYWAPNRKPSVLSSVKLPVLAMLAEHDEYADRPAEEMADWFLKHIYEGEVRVIGKVGHSFKGAEKKVANIIKQWSRENS